MKRSHLINLSIIGIREAFISFIPYVILISIFTLISQILYTFDIVLPMTNLLLNKYFPLVVFILMIYHLSNRHHVDYTMSFLISISILLTIHSMVAEEGSIKSLYDTIGFLFISIPITTVITLHFYKISPIGLLFLKTNTDNLLRYFLIFFKVYFLWVVIYFLLYTMFSYFFILFHLNIPKDIYIYIRTFLVQIFWFTGMHGDNTFNLITNNIIMLDTFSSTISYSEIFNLFVLNGGSGATSALIIAIFIGVKERNMRHIAKISIPFSFFNISEVMVFGLPIIFNKYLLIPFIFIPLFNAYFALSIFSFYNINIIHHDVAWITPMFFNIYYATGGDFFAIFIQFLIFTLNIIIYLPFVKRYAKTQSVENYHDTLQSYLGVTQAYNEKKDLQAYEAKYSIIKSNIKMESIISLLQENTMLLYFQPIVDVNNNTVSHYEALLRLELNDGKVLEPYFLKDIENAGFASMIDLWVCKEIKKHLLTLDNKYKNIQLNINIHPHTLSNTANILKIIEILKYENIGFEIIERELFNNQLAKENIMLLKKNGFKIYIDDMGDGYSNYMALCTLPLDCIKIDKSLTDIIHTYKGFSVVKHIFNLSQSLGYQCIIEGVETQEQMKIVKKIGIPYVQGYYYSKALKIQEAYNYKVQF